ncbi:MAG: hypothetical protein MHM6MM_005405 [Cercozoa sp. M6MM]
MSQMELPELPEVTALDITFTNDDCEVITARTEHLRVALSSNIDDVSPDLIKEYVFVVIPGNPGIVSFYRRFAVELLRAFVARLNDSNDTPYRVTVLGYGHAGHTKQENCDSVMYNLRDQVRHKVAILDAVRHEFPQARLALLGHSVGAYINNCARIESPQQIEHMGYLFPTFINLEVQPAVRALQWPLLREFTSFALSLVPTSLAHRIAGWLSSSDLEVLLLKR